jgi:hypothetical protein
MVVSLAVVTGLSAGVAPPARAASSGSSSLLSRAAQQVAADVKGVAGPARASLAAVAALPPPLTPTGGDFEPTMPYSGVSQTEASYLASTTLPEALGLPASPTLDEELAALYQRTSGALSDAGVTTVAPAPSDGGSVSVSATAATVTVPAAALPPNAVANPSGPAAATAAFAAGLAVGIVGFIGCAVITASIFKLAPPAAGSPPGSNGTLTTAQSNACAIFAAMVTALVALVVIGTWAGATITAGQWVAIVVGVLTAGLSAGWFAYGTPWMLQLGVYLGLGLASGVSSLFTALAPWIPSWSTIVANGKAVFGWAAAGVTTAFKAAWNAITGSSVSTLAAGLPQITATGTVEDDSISSTQECMDAYGADANADGGPVEGQPAAINACDGSADQAWVQWSNNNLSNGGLCLDITGASWWLPEAPLELWECNGQWNQLWQHYLAPDYQAIQNPYPGSKYCIDDPNWNETPGTQLQDWFCHGETAEYWVLPADQGAAETGTSPSVTDYGPVDSGQSGECMDAYGTTDGASPGQIVAINACDGDLSQEWTAWSDGTVQVWGLCLDTTGGTQPLTGTPLVDLETCDGAASQDWVPQSDGALENSASGTCLDDPLADTSAGVELDVFPCNGSPAQQWALPAPLPDQTGPSLPSGASVCDIYAYYGTPCAAAYSMTRALYASYDGPLYQVTRASDGTTRNIGLLAAGGYVDAAAQGSFCATGCTVTEIYDQSPDGNNLTIAGPGGPTCSSAPGYSCSGEADHGADASLVPVTVGGSADIEAYGLDITGGVGYADDATRGVATGDQPEGTYMVASGTNVNGQCCMDFGNAETSRDDDGNGHMDAVRIGTGAGIPGTCWFTPCNGSGPWVGVDMENGTFLGGNGSYLGNTPVPDDFVTAMAENDGQSTYAIDAGNAQSGGLTTEWSGALPDLGGYMPMQKEGGIVLGTGGDNSNAGIGTWFEGVMTSGYPSSAAEAAVQANIVAAGYEGNSAGPAGTSSSTGSSAGTAGQAVVHDGYTSVYTVNAANGDLDETYLPAAGDPWATQDLSATVGTPPVMRDTQPVALYHDGYTSVYTVDAGSGDLQETYLAALCAPGCAPGQGWVTQDLTKYAGAPTTVTTPSAVFHDGYVSVYTADAGSGDLQETYLAAICAPDCAPGQGWATQDLTKYVGTPPVLGQTAPVAVLHDGYVSVYTVDASGSQTGHLQETYLATLCAPGCAPGQGWATQDLTKYVGTPTTSVTPGADYHSGYTSVYTVDASSGDLQETYLAAICAPGCAPGQGWATQDLSATVGTPQVGLGTSPVALFHDGYNSVYTDNASNGDLDETYLAAICAPDCAPGQGWATQDLSVNPGTPPTVLTPIALLHPDQSGAMNWVSVWTINLSDNHLDETYLPALCAPNCAPGQGWVTKDLTATVGTPPAT